MKLRANARIRGTVGATAVGLQSSRLMMVGLGVLGDAPAVAEQSKLRDGVHLRWSSPRHVALPWYGYFLYRRRSREKKLDGCLSRSLSLISLGTATDALSTADGRLSSSSPLSFTDDFPQLGVAEVDLANRGYVRFDRPAGQPAHRFFVRIGLREQLDNIRCLDFDDVRLPAAELPLRIGDVTIVGRRARGVRGILGRPALDREAAKTALALDGDVDIEVPRGASWVEVEVQGIGKPFALSAIAADDKASEERRLQGTAGKREVVRLSVDRLTGVRLRAKGTTVWLHRICYQVGRRREKSIRLEGLASALGGDPSAVAVVATATASGQPGDIVEAVLTADRMTGVRVLGGDAALLEVCWSDVEQGATEGWEPLPKCPQPLSLPVRDPDYPAWQGSQDVALAEGMGTGRVFYGAGADWQGAPFADLHEQCAMLVKGGPAAADMDDPSRAPSGIAATAPPPGIRAPDLQSLHPLDVIMLGSVHRPIAEILGLSWTDETAGPGETYDYLIAADRDGYSGGSADKLLQFITASGFPDGVDGWICFEQKSEAGPGLPPPADVKVFALPGGSVRPGARRHDPIEHIAGSAGLTWARQTLPFGWLQPGAFVMHHLWRGDAGNALNPNMPAEADDWLTKNRAVLSAVPSAAPTSAPATPADWPSFAFDFVDFRLSEGWYAYQLAGVDIFGRFSPKGPFVSWWQWSPEPTPRPWYYVGTSIDQEVNHQAVRILDKSRPPIPIGLEAFVLDPDDPLVVKDANYTAWRAALGSAATIGLRVRWRWTLEQQRNAPGVTEFRLYWSGGSTPPAGRADPEGWPDRFFVCPYAQHFAIELDPPTRDRVYEVFLPVAGGGTFAGGVPLAPTLATPIAYANVTVTSADAVAHTSDRWPGAGPLAGRAGSESACAPPQKVFEVWRQKPAPPEPIVDSERVYATPADWNGNSYHTFRWAPQPHLFTHVCRAIDEAVFEVDWAAQPLPPLAINDAAFPNAAAEPIWNNAKKTQVAALINQVAGLLGVAPSDAEKKAAKPQALGLYRALQDDALRVLASRSSSDKAFVQVTTSAIDAAAAPDLRGPDDAPGYVPVAGRCAFIDKMDGRATNRLLYRAAFVDGAQNRSLLGGCATPVRLPDVTPPHAPVLVKVTGGDRVITLAWASNQEADLLEYRIYRASNEADARDLRTMTHVAVVAADPIPAARPGKVEWSDAGVPGRRDFWYRLVAVDRVDPVDVRGGGGNVSLPSPPIRARAFDDSVPVPPVFATLDWVRVDRNDAVFPFAGPPAGLDLVPAVRLTWPAAGADDRLLIQVKSASETAFRAASGWLPPATTSFIHRTNHVFEPMTYQIKVVNGAGTANTHFNPAVLATP